MARFHPITLRPARPRRGAYPAVHPARVLLALLLGLVWVGAMALAWGRAEAQPSIAVQTPDGVTEACSALIYGGLPSGALMLLEPCPLFVDGFE